MAHTTGPLPGLQSRSTGATVIQAQEISEPYGKAQSLISFNIIAFPQFGTTGVDSDMVSAARTALKEMIEYLCSVHGISPYGAQRGQPLRCVWNASAI